MVQYGVKLHRSDDLRLPAHPDAADPADLGAWCAARTGLGIPIAVDLFSGAGGLSAGLEMSGWSVALAVDHDQAALATHRHNFPGAALDLTLGSVEGRDRVVKMFDGIPVDLVAGGPPCQPFSRAGQSKLRSLIEAGVRSSHDHRRELWSSFLDIALRIRPRAILMENVPDMGIGDDFRVIRVMMDEMEKAGYRTDLRIVDAWKYGVPQHRRRLILLARRDGETFHWPAPQDKPTTLRDSIADLPGLCGELGARVMPYAPATQMSAFAARMRSKAPLGLVHDHMTRPVRADDLEAFGLMRPGTRYSALPSHLKRYNSDIFDDKYNRLPWDDLSRSITAHLAKDGYWYIHPEENRSITVREAARIQTFPDDFRFAGTRSHAFRQIGNAVPPLLGAAAASALRSDPSAETDNQDLRAARSSLERWTLERSTSDQWFAFPSAHTTAPVALIVALTARGRPRSDAVRAAVEPLKGRVSLSPQAVKTATGAFGTAKVGEYLKPIVQIEREGLWQQPEDWPHLLRMGANESRLFSLLRGDDVLLRSTGPMRVAARFAGTEDFSANKLTAGLTILARVVGGGTGAAINMAGIRVLAGEICTVESPKCSVCPLAAQCNSSRLGKQLP